VRFDPAGPRSPPCAGGRGPEQRGEPVLRSVPPSPSHAARREARAGTRALLALVRAGLIESRPSSTRRAARRRTLLLGRRAEPCERTPFAARAAQLRCGRSAARGPAGNPLALELPRGCWRHPGRRQHRSPHESSGATTRRRSATRMARLARAVGAARTIRITGASRLELGPARAFLSLRVLVCGMLAARGRARGPEGRTD